MACLCMVACGGSPSVDGGPSDASRASDASTSLPDGNPTDGGASDAGPLGLGHPFGTHRGYVDEGVVFPSRPTTELDAATASRYDLWKARYLEPACTDGQVRIHPPSTGPYTVSEGHGYAMLATVIMAGHDPEARPLFDGLYAYFTEHRDTQGLMAWAQSASCANVMGADSATDGDLDVAYALLLADRQWGSDGAIDYRTRGLELADAILAAEIHPTADTVLVGDWVDASDSHYDGSRTSDFMTGHFRSFAGATNAARWTEVLDKTYGVVAALQADHAPSTGLLPDFVVSATSASPRPAPAGWLEGSDDGRYGYNACRVPWRLATDYLMSGEMRARDAVRRINAWIRSTTGDDPSRVVDGYRLNGDATGTGPDLAFVAPFGVSAMVEPTHGTNQPWLDALWDRVAAADLDQYYGNTLALLAMIVMSGNWWAP